MADRRMRWHRWCGPQRRGGLPIERPAEVLPTDEAIRRRAKVISLAALESAHAQGDGHLVARLIRPLTSLLTISEAADHPLIAQVQDIDSQPRLFAVPDHEAASC